MPTYQPPTQRLASSLGGRHIVKLARRDYSIIGVCGIVGAMLALLQIKGSVALATSGAILLLFAVALFATPRLAIFSAFALSLFQPLLTRLLFSLDFPDAGEHSMVGYKDPLTTSTSLILMGSAGLAFLYHMRQKLGAIGVAFTTLVTAYALLNLVLIFNPSASILQGIYGTKNNLAPLFMIFAGAFVVRSHKEVITFSRFLTIFGGVAAGYAIFQELFGFVGFEAFWFSRAVPETSSMFLYFVGDVEVRDPYGATSMDIRVPSVFSGYTFFSYSIAALGILVYACRESHQAPFWWIIRRLVLVLLLVYFALSLERAAIMMFAIGVLAVHFARSREKQRTARFMFFGAIAIFILSTMFSLATQQLIERNLVAGNPKLARIVELANPFTASTVTIGRFREHWPTAMKVIRKHPYTGTGPGTGMYTRAAQSRDEFIQPHNEFLHKLVELGPFGLVLFVGILFSLYSLVISECSNETNSPERRSYAAGTVGVLAAFVACGVMNVPFLYQPGIVFWFLAGAALGRETPDEFDFLQANRDT